MKFAEHLAAHITPEWRKQYIQYEEMKAMLYAGVERAPSPEVVEQSIITRYFANFDEEFFHHCEKELTKINTFFSEKIAEATRKSGTLKSELHNMLTRDNEEKGWGSVNKKKSALGLRALNRQATKHVRIQTRKIHDLKLAFSEFYLSLILLQNYQNLNFTGFRKILKKHDKLLGTDAGAKWRVILVEIAPFYVNKDIDKLIQDTEILNKCIKMLKRNSRFEFVSFSIWHPLNVVRIVTRELEGGDRQKAMKRLRVPPLNDKHSPWITFKVGLFSGAFIVLLCAVIVSGIFIGVEDWRIVVRLYRGSLLLVLFLFLIGINVYGWRTSGVNHVLIFELDPRNHLSEQHLMEMAAIFGVMWALSVLAFLYSKALSIPAYANPLSLVVIMLLFLFNPTKTMRHQARFWLLRVLSSKKKQLPPEMIDGAKRKHPNFTGRVIVIISGKKIKPALVQQGRIIAAPFFYVGFADFWLADQLNSLVPVLVDFQYFVCFYTTGINWSDDKDAHRCIDDIGIITRPIVACLPAWFRFAQCLRRYRDSKEAFPHLVNAGKYSTTFFNVIFSSLYVAFRQQYGTTWSNPFFYMWIISAVISSCYTYLWDIKMDWGLFDTFTGDNRFLREEIVYSSPNYYYFAVVEDLILRFGWTLSVSLTELEFIHSDLMASIFAPLEVIRRFVWNFFRLENEHLNNCGNFRAVRDISVAPLESSDQTLLLFMMDESDGVINRKKKERKYPNRRKKSETRILLEGNDTDDQEI